MLHLDGDSRPAAHCFASRGFFLLDLDWDSRPESVLFGFLLLFFIILYYSLIILFIGRLLVFFFSLLYNFIPQTVLALEGFLLIL